MKKYILSLLLLASVNLQAGTDFKSFKEVVIQDTKFKDTELQLNLFYLQTFGPAASGYTINTGSGGGFGVNYIFARYFGVGVDNFWYDNNNNSNYFLMPTATFRYPIESLSLAPYAVVGGGVGFGKTNVGFGTVGGGIEYRITPHLGTYVDARWLYGAPNNAATLSTGLKIVF